MKLFLIGTLLFSGGTAAAMQNEEVRENVTQAYKNVRERVQKRVKENTYNKIREEGFPYPSEEKLAVLTEEQSTAIITAIDQINATYDWANMTDEEIKEALEIAQEELNLLAEELGLELQDNWMQRKFRRKVNQKTKEIIQEHMLNNLREKGIEYPSEERLAEFTEEEQLAITTKIDELNATYDWANMTDEEILEAMVTVKEEIKLLAEELGIELPFGKREQKPTLEERIEGLRENGLQYPNEKRVAELSEEQVSAIMTKVDELNETYDWATMTDEEIMEALEVVKTEFNTLREELGIEPPQRRGHRRHHEQEETVVEEETDNV